MSEENKKQGHNGTGGAGGFFSRLFGKKSHEPESEAAEMTLDEIIDEENRDIPEEQPTHEDEPTDIPETSPEDIEADVQSSGDTISDEDYSDILSEVMGEENATEEAPAEDTVSALKSELQEMEALADDEVPSGEKAQDEPEDGAELLKKIMEMKAEESASEDENSPEGEIEDASDGHEDVGANTDVFEDYEYVADAADNDTSSDTAAADNGTDDADSAAPEADAGADGEVSEVAEDNADDTNAALAKAIAEATAGEAATDKKSGIVGDDDVDDDLMLALGYNSDASAQQETKTERSELDRHIRDNRPDYAGAFGYRGEEYRSRSQAEDIKKAYRADTLGMILRACGTAILTIVILIFELFGKKFGGALSMTDYPTVHILVSMQLLLLAAAISWRQMINGFVGIFRFELTPHSAAAATVAVVLLYDAAMAIAAPEAFTLYDLPAALCLVMSVVYDILDLERQVRAFNSISSWESFCTLERADAVELAVALDSSSSGRREDASIRSAMRLHRGNFAENYFSRTNRKNPALKALNYVIAPVIALSLVIFLISLAAGRGFVTSANTFTVMVLIAMPVFTMAALIYPFCDLAKNVLKPSEVLLNETEAENYASADAVIFGEEDVFGPRSLMIKRIGLCGNAVAQDIFEVLEGVSAVFDKVGGALAGAFRRAAESGSSASSENTEVEILRVCDGGISARVGLREYLIGSENFMILNGIKAPADPDDRDFVNNGGSAVMYIAVGGEVTLKMYVTYVADDAFRELVSTLSERGISPVMISNDPNIDDALLTRILGELKCPVRVIHDTSVCEEKPEADKDQADAETVDAGLIADGSDWTSLVSALSACSKLCRVSALNMRISFGIIAVSVLLAAFLGALGILNGMHSAYVALYQIICILPAVISSKLMLN